MADVSGNMSEKLKALEAARLQIEKQYGQNSLMRLGMQGSVAGVDVVPSGSILLDEALGVGVEPSAIQQYERTLDYLDGISDDSISDESERGETLRKQLIYQDFINRGYNKERDIREVNKSFNAGSDIDDAKEAFKMLTKGRPLVPKTFTDEKNIEKIR